VVNNILGHDFNLPSEIQTACVHRYVTMLVTAAPTQDCFLVAILIAAGVFSGMRQDMSSDEDKEIWAVLSTPVINQLHCAIPQHSSKKFCPGWSDLSVSEIEVHQH
jgi:hypothetical protein